MRRALPALRLLQQAAAGPSTAAAAAASAGTGRNLHSFPFSSPADAPPPAGSSAVSISAKSDGTSVTVDVKAGGAAAKASYAAAAVRPLQASAVTLYDTPRISVLHASLMSYLLRLAHERYSVLAQWPDFTAMYGKDYYYRAHPEDVRKFYELVDEFHRMWDVVTEFDSLSHLATQLIPAQRKARMNVLGPAVGPTTANGMVTQFLLAHAK